MLGGVAISLHHAQHAVHHVVDVLGAKHLLGSAFLAVLFVVFFAAIGALVFAHDAQERELVEHLVHNQLNGGVVGRLALLCFQQFSHHGVCPQVLGAITFIDVFGQTCHFSDMLKHQLHVVHCHNGVCAKYMLVALYEVRSVHISVFWVVR